MLTLRSVVKRYGPVVALDGIDLEIAAGECFGLLGPNGAGKSTLMSVVCGLRAPDTGEVLLAGRPLAAGEAAGRHQVGYVPQSVALYPELTAEQNLRIFGQLYGLRGRELAARIDEALGAVQLGERRRERVKSFSGGMQRRLNIAASLLHRPRLLLCDEPTVGVDPQSRNAIFEHLRQLHRAGTTIVYSTHYMEEAERLCDRIAIIDHGRILASGTLEALLAQLPFQEEIAFPADASTAALLPELAGWGELTSENGTHRFRPAPNCPRSQFYALTERLGLAARLFTAGRPSLEAVFLHLTGRHLRD